MSNRVLKESGDVMYIDGDGRGNGGGSWDGLGGIGAIIALVVVVAILWFLAREGRGNDGCYGGGGYAPYPYPPYPAYPPYGGGGNCCSPLDCKIPMTPDMSNCEVDRDLWKVDSHVEKCCCETQKEILADGSKTREVLYADKVEALRDKLAEAYSEKSALKTQIYTDAKFDALNAKLCKEDCETDKQFGYLAGAIKDLKGYIDCNIPKLPPRWCDSVTPNTHHTDCQHNDFPRRGKCCNDCDGYGLVG